MYYLHRQTFWQHSHNENFSRSLVATISRIFCFKFVSETAFLIEISQENFKALCPKNFLRFSVTTIPRIFQGYQWQLYQDFFEILSGNYCNSVSKLPSSKKYITEAIIADNIWNEFSFMIMSSCWIFKLTIMSFSHIFTFQFSYHIYTHEMSFDRSL